MAAFQNILYILQQTFGQVALFILTVCVAPLLVALFYLCWIRAKLTALIYKISKKYILLTSQEAMAGLEFDSTHTLINTVYFMNDDCPVSVLKEVFASKVVNAKDAKNKHLFPQFTRYIVLRAGYLMWSEETNFSIDDHIRPYHGQPPHDEEELKSIINHLCNSPIPSCKSGWEIVAIPMECGRTCILFRVHHCIADGISIFRLVIEQMAGNHGAFQNVLKRMERKFQSRFKIPFVAALVDIVQLTYNMLLIPNNMLINKKLYNKTKHIISDWQLRGMRHYDWTAPIKFNRIIDIREATSTTVNDVIMSCVAGAFRKYLVKRGICPPELLLTAVPINFQSSDDPIEMNNKFLSVLTHLPIGEMDCLQRLKTTKTMMDQMKRSPDVIINRWFIQHCVNVLPYVITKSFLDWAKMDVAVSNIPGPSRIAYFDNHTIESIFLIPQISSNFDVGVSIFSYAGEVIVSATVDKAIDSSGHGVRLLLDGFVEELQQLFSTCH